MSEQPESIPSEESAFLSKYEGGHFVLNPPEGIDTNEFFASPEVQVYQLFLQGITLVDDYLAQIPADQSLAKSQLKQVADFFISTDKVKTSILTRELSYADGAVQLQTLQESLLEDPVLGNLFKDSLRPQQEKLMVNYRPLAIEASKVSTVVHDVKNIIHELQFTEPISGQISYEKRQKIWNIVDILNRQETQRVGASVLEKILLDQPLSASVQITHVLEMRQKKMQSEWYFTDASAVRATVESSIDVDALAHIQVNCDPAYLESLKHNALINAAEHALLTPGDEGVYEANVRMNISIGVNTRGTTDYVEIVFQDNGEGISQERFDFEMGVTAQDNAEDNDDTSSNTHTAMAGLARIFKAQGGELFLRKRQDQQQGAELVLLLPASEAEDDIIDLSHLSFTGSRSELLNLAKNPDAEHRPVRRIVNDNTPVIIHRELTAIPSFHLDTAEYVSFVTYHGDSLDYVPGESGKEPEVFLVGNEEEVGHKGIDELVKELGLQNKKREPESGGIIHIDHYDKKIRYIRDSDNWGASDKKVVMAILAQVKKELGDEYRAIKPNDDLFGYRQFRKRPGAD